MGITVLISLYTTRLILSTLGASDFGIFNIVGGAIAMLGFLNSTMANATQRFMSYAEGEGILLKKIQIFNVSFLLHIFISIITIILLLLVMYPLFHSILVIEPTRLKAAQIIYLCLIASTAFTIINVPYDAIINAHENMLYFALVGIFESILKLIVAFACLYTSYDKLIVYGFLMALIPFITLSIMKIYCHKHYEECVFHPVRYWNPTLVKKIAFFSGWNFLTAVSSLITFQGIGIVLNHFFGTILNAAQGIANQLNGQLSSLSANMMKALNPIIVKNAGKKNIELMNSITISGSKFSTFLILFFAVPCIIEMPYILNLWLKSVPDWTVVFCRLQLLQTIICQMANSISTAVYAQGNIKMYAIYKSIMNLLPVLLTYICFVAGGSPIWLYIPMIIFWAIGGNLVIIYFGNKSSGLNISRFFEGIFFPVSLVSLIMFISGSIFSSFFSDSFIHLILLIVVTTFSMLFSIFLFGLTKSEKVIVHNYIENIFHFPK